MKNVITFTMFLLVFVLASCASSERLTRMSGGVFTEYSAPKQYRLRSEKFQAQSRALGSDKKISHGKAAGLDDTLVNIWPFFFASNNYWCALWPMIDCDPYGFAVRPLFNKEGNDCSILFPLSSWNNESKSGWIANFAWGPGAFGFIPLTWQSQSSTKSMYYYTPLFILEKRHFKLSHERTQNINHSFFCCLAYGKKETSATTAHLPHDWLFKKYTVNTDFKNEWLFRYRNGGAPGNVPQNEKELTALKKNLFKQHKTEIKKSFGVFPLFHVSNGTCAYREWVAGPLLAGYEKDSNLTRWYLLAGLGADFKTKKHSGAFKSQYTDNVKESVNRTIFPLLTRCKLEHRYCGKRYRLFEKFNAKHYNESFSEALPRLKKTLKEISPAIEMPEEVRDWNTFYLFRAELAAKENFPTNEYKTIFSGPFFFLNRTPDKTSWLVPILLSWGETTKERKEFVSLPLLTFIKQGKSKGYTCIVPPVISWSNFEHKNKLHKPIHSNVCKWSGKFGVVEEINQYAALGLFYRGRHAFTVAKENFDFQKAEFVRKNLLNLGRDYQFLTSNEKSTAERQRDAEAWKTSNKIEYYKKLIRFEELKAEREKHAERRKKYDSLREKVTAKAKELGIELAESDFSSVSSAEKAVGKLLEHATELRWKEDFGNGLFFRKENFYNGDYNWHFCHILAGGKKEGDKLSMHILHLLYRKRQEGNRTETIFFPFISHVKEGNNERTSFLWRVFSIGSRNSKTGGHILFIPYGEKI